MQLFDLPYVNGYKSAIGSWGLLLTATGYLFYQLGMVMQGQADISVLIPAVEAFFGAFGLFGIAHKAQKIQDNVSLPK